MPKKCKNCGNPFVPKFSSLEKYCDKEDCRIKYAIEVVQKQKKQRIARERAIKKAWQNEKKVLNEKLKGIPEYKKELEAQINKICCLIDYGSGCISCKGHTTPQCGHYHTVHSNGSIRYHLDNLHLQDYNCNCAKAGNIQQYDLGLIERYGSDYWEFVKFKLPLLYPLLKITLLELKEKLPIAKKIVKELKETIKVYSNEEKLLLRKRFNRELGIYEE